MNNTQKIIVEQTIGLGLGIPSEAYILRDYILPAIRDSGIFGLFGSLMNVLVTLFTIFLTIAMYAWIMDLEYNIRRTKQLMRYRPQQFENFVIGLVLIFIITFFVVVIIKNKLGL